MRCSYVLRNGELVEKHGPLDVREPRQRSPLPSPMLIRDSIDDFMSMSDFKTYDSKSAYYQSIKQAGLEIVGNEKMQSRDNDDVPVSEYKADIAEAYNELT